MKDVYSMEQFQAELEREWIELFLQESGYHLADLHALPEQRARELMCAACTFASLKLAEAEATNHLARKVLPPV